MAKFIYVKRAAEMVGVTPQTIRNLCKKNALPHKETARGIMVSEEAVKKLEYKIKEIEATDNAIDKLIDDCNKLQAAYQETKARCQERLCQIGLYPKRIIAIRNLLDSVLRSHYQNKLTPREFQIVIDVIQGKDEYEMSDKYMLTRARIFAIWNKALRRLAIKKNIIAEKDEEIARLKKVIEDKNNTILELKGVKEQELIKINENKAMVAKLSQRLQDCDLSVRALNCLYYADIKTVYDLVLYKRADLLKFRNFGKKSLTELDEFLDRMGLAFGMVDVIKYELAVKEAVNGTR